MIMNRKLSLWGSLLVAAWAAAGCQRSGTAVPASPQVELDQGVFRISGPYAHENLSVFLVHSQKQDEREFITLDQGFKDGVVKVMEKDQEQVNELQIDNQSEKPLFLQEGDRLKGGKQDRTIIASLVIPPNSGKTPLPTFCIEQGRWVAGARGKAFGGTENTALATKDVRKAAKFSKNQNAVWEEVRAQKEVAGQVLMVAGATTSLNEALDSPQVKKLSDEFANALSGILHEHDDAVGVAIVVNGAIEEVNIYPNHKLLSKLYPRLLQSYALQATAQKGQAKDAKPVSCDEVAQFMKTEGKEKSKRTDKIDARNLMQLGELENAYQCATSYDGTVVHRQVMAKNAQPQAPRPQQAPNPPGP